MQNTTRYFFFALLIATFIGVVWIVSPFLSVIVLAIALSVVLQPLYKKIVNLFGGKYEWLASLISVIVFIIVVLGPLVLLGLIVFNESTALYSRLAHGGSYHTFIANSNAFLERYLPSGMHFDVEHAVTQVVGTVSANIASIFATTLNTVFSFLLLVLAVFYFLKDGKRFRKFILMLSPLKDTDDEQILSRLRDAINGVVRGYLLIALIQGILLGIGLTIFGMPNAALLGFAGAVASLVPSIGTAIVSIPIIIYFFATGNVASGIGFAIWAGALVGMVDNMLNPYLVGRKVQLPPLVILFSVLGGVSLLGPVGILIGPLVVSLLYALISIYKTEFSS